MTTTKITVINRPRDAHHLPGLPLASEERNQLDNGAISANEVGPPISVSTQFGLLQAFKMRGSRPNKIPTHLFGKLDMNDSFSEFDVSIYSLPSVGGELYIEPSCTQVQRYMMDQCYSATADAVIILLLDEPFGGSQLIHVYCPELDETTITRGFRWKPSVQSSVACYVPFSSDIRYRIGNTGGPRPGFPGLGIKLKVLEDTSTSTVVKPLKLTVFTCINNLVCVGFKPNCSFESFGELLSYLERSLAEVPPPPSGETYQRMTLHMESNEAVNGPTGDADTQPPPEVVQSETPEKPPVKDYVPVETTIKVSSNPKGKKTSRPNAGEIANRWIPFGDYAIDATVLSLVYKNVEIDSYNFDTLGDSIARQFRRNVWCSGSEELGYMTGIRVRIITNKPPHVAGTLEFTGCKNGGVTRTFCKLGSSCEFEVMFDTHRSITMNPRQYRSLNSPWVRTNQSQSIFSYRLISFNRSSELTGIKMQVFIAPGSINVQTPIRPKPKPTKTELNLVSDLKRSFVRMDLHMQMGPSPVQGEEAGEITSNDADFEEIDQDSFWVRLPDIKLKNGEQKMIDMDLSKIVDQFGFEGNNSISEKFERYANLIPSKAGPFGPVIGEYKIVPRFPTGITAQISHVCLPGDMNIDSAERIFGLSNILSIAGSALSSIGGPLISGAINTIGNIAKPILGSDIVDTVTGLATGVLGGLGQATTPQPPMQQPQSIGGDIPVSRIYEFIKLIDSNEKNNPAFGKLLIGLLDVLTNNPSVSRDEVELPLQVYVKMSALTERNLINRTYLPNQNNRNELYVEFDDAVELLYRLKKSNRSALAGKLFATLNRFSRSVEDPSMEMIDINPDNLPEPTSDELTTLHTRFGFSP